MVPLIIGVYPENGSTDVALDKPIVIAFADAIDESTITSDNIIFENLNTISIVEWDYSYNPETCELTIIPKDGYKDNVLFGLTDYRITIKNLASPNGEVMMGEHQIRFTTVSDSVEDVIEPPSPIFTEEFAVVSTYPKQGSCNITPDAIKIKFNKDVVPDSVNSDTFKVTADAIETLDDIDFIDFDEIPGEYIVSKNIVTFIPCTEEIEQLGFGSVIVTETLQNVFYLPVYPVSSAVILVDEEPVDENYYTVDLETGKIVFDEEHAPAEGSVITAIIKVVKESEEPAPEEPNEPEEPALEEPDDPQEETPEEQEDEIPDEQEQSEEPIEPEGPEEAESKTEEDTESEEPEKLEPEETEEELVVEVGVGAYIAHFVNTFRFNNTSALSVRLTVGGVAVNEGVDYTVDLKTGEITFTEGHEPEVGAEVVALVRRRSAFEDNKKYTVILSGIQHLTEEDEIETIEPTMFSFYSRFSPAYATIESVCVGYSSVARIIRSMDPIDVLELIRENSERAFWIAEYNNNANNITWDPPETIVVEYVKAKTRYDIVFDKYIQISGEASSKSLGDLQIEYDTDIESLLGLADRLKAMYEYWENMLKGSRSGKVRAQVFRRGENYDEDPNYKSRALKNWDGNKSW